MKSVRKRVMIDMDNVITDGVFLDLVNEFLGEHYKLEDMRDYYLQDLVLDREEEFWNWIQDKSFYDGASLLEGCYEVLEKLNEVYDVYIVTAYLWNEMVDVSGENLKNKYYYLKEKLPFLAPEKYIFTTNKNILNFDIKIDDRLDNLEGAQTKLLFDAWHNREFSKEELESKQVIRVKNWYDIEKLLLK